MHELTQGRLKELLSYDPATGEFRWLQNRNRMKAGDLAGCNSRYRYIHVESRIYRAHRLAWVYVYGNWPVGQVDHIDGNRLNNAIANLREATNTQNQHNRGLSKTNTSGVKGVSWNKEVRKWHAKIRIAGRLTYLGSFAELEQAAAAYRDAADKHHGEFARVA